MSVNHLCWCCLLRPSEKDLTTPYLNYGITEIYSDMLIECFEIHLTLGHEGECGICEECVGRLRDARDFKLQVQRSQVELRARLERAVQVKDEKPIIHHQEMAYKDGTSDTPMLDEEFTTKSERLDEDRTNDGMFYEPDVTLETYNNESSSNFTTKNVDPPVKTEIMDDGVAEPNLIRHEEPPGKPEMSDNEMSDADLILHESLVDFSTPDDADASKIIPSRSKDRYVATYDNFIAWKTVKNTSSFSENVLLAYFEEISEKYKPTSLWAMYSMLKSTLKSKNSVNIEDYAKLSAFLKKKSDGYVGKKTMVLTGENIEQFIDEAPDDKYLVTKVALILGVSGALRRQELSEITTEDIENHDGMILVKIPPARKSAANSRSFVIQGKYYNVVKKYQNLRSMKGVNNRFFQQYRNGKCTAQSIGKNKFGNMPKEVAEYLNLPDAKLYTGHSFRRSSATLLADSGADLFAFKRRGLKTSHAVKTYDVSLNS